MSEIGIERTELGLDVLENTRVGDCGFYLGPVADDAGVCHQEFYFGIIVGQYLVAVEVVEGFSEGFAFVEYALPGQAGLETFQNHKFQQFAVVVHGTSPFLVVVMDVEGIFGIGPKATWFGWHGNCVGVYFCFFLRMAVMQQATRMEANAASMAKASLMMKTYDSGMGKYGRA